MNFKSPFLLQCLLVITTVSDGSAIRIGVFSGSPAVFPVGTENLQNLSEMRRNDASCVTHVINDTLLAECDSYRRCLNLQNGSLMLRSVVREDEGKYNFVFDKTDISFTLEVFEAVISAQCFPNGTGELSCSVTSNESMRFVWWLNGTELRGPKTCADDDGKKVYLYKTMPGEFVCEVQHKNTIMKTRPIVLSCSYGDLLQYPLFIYILAGCAGAAVILVVVVSSLICCYMRRKNKFIAVPSEEEKDDGITMSVVSSEGVKSPPNGDHVEAQAGPVACPPVPDAAQTGPGTEPQPMAEENLPVAAEPGKMPDPEMIVNVENQESASDCFPDPADD